MKSASQILEEAAGILITAGAGMGVDSGLPDFRGNEGFWKAYPPIAKLGIGFSQMANPEWFRIDPELAWAFYGHRYNLYKSTVPHAGFRKLLELGETKKHKYFVFTSNVDGQFQKAGFADERIKECHGSINHFQCTTPCGDDIWKPDYKKINVDEENFKGIKPLPSCPNCGALARPNILMFGDYYWLSSRTDNQADKLYKWLSNFDNTGDKLAIIELGAGKAVPTVRFTSERTAHQYNATLIRINPRDYNVPKGHISIKKGALDGINSII